MMELQRVHTVVQCYHLDSPGTVMVLVQLLATSAVDRIRIDSDHVNT